jgi:hypothetical protein
MLLLGFHTSTAGKLANRLTQRLQEFGLPIEVQAA